MKRAATALAAFCICVLACASSRAQSVVVNKYQNSGTTADIVELLVIQDSLDMRGMFLKDFSSNMVTDGGGKYQFTTDPLWASVPAGTLVVLRNTNNGTDATGAATGLTFGAGNNANNTAYINSLRVTGPAPEPTVQASNVVFSSVGATAMNVSWTNGNGASRIVLAKQGSPVDAAPSDGTAYTASAAFGSGSELSPATVTISALAVRSGRTTVVATALTGRAM